VNTRLRVALGIVVVALGVLAAPVRAQQSEMAPRPRPYPVFESPAFARAVEQGTRTRSGRPGPGYVNHSPDTLRLLAVSLRQNVFAAGARRAVPTPVTSGVALGRVVVGATVENGALAGGRELRPAAADTSPGYQVDGTVVWIRLPEPVAPRGGTVDLGFEWSHAPPPVPADGREGQDGEVFMMGYWYPQLAVYDDVGGWAAHPYLGSREFYMGFADYDVRAGEAAVLRDATRSVRRRRVGRRSWPGPRRWLRCCSWSSSCAGYRMGVRTQGSCDCLAREESIPSLHANTGLGSLGLVRALAYSVPRPTAVLPCAGERPTVRQHTVGEIGRMKGRGGGRRANGKGVSPSAGETRQAFEGIEETRR
jgi:hypothetical protein